MVEPAVPIEPLLAVEPVVPVEPLLAVELALAPPSVLAELVPVRARRSRPVRAPHPVT
jgi:hypothetical protein